MFTLPDRVRDRACSLGPSGAAWLAGLPDLVAGLAADWALTIGEPLSGGSASLVLRATDGNGEPVVLKLGQPDGPLAEQADTLRRAGGRGYARLQRFDEARNALLVEGLGPSLETAGSSPERTIEVLCALLREAWLVPRPAAPPGAPEKAASLGAFIGEAWPALGRPGPERVIETALGYAERRAAAYDPDRSVVVHGDPHPANALLRRGDGYVFVDPDGFLADPGYDLGVVLRDWLPELAGTDDPDALLRGYCRLLARRAGVDAEVIWEWGFLERVSTGLYCLRYGAPELGRRFLASAERLR
ncbi:aminoglycoside phosphotransferase family protein [Microlunatus parietis]|uniref:Streptomycin 6-kinase n=1 Tax=Microlunatus parietis TaxID=682979 RepID=A0A7Y9I1Z8_9ACTN|nr:aminoglycoside phosphotransferase family protein [Microlunatus parietis]NYE68741.1 streptomycin 6-kinase [Microlunatus parietis]